MELESENLVYTNNIHPKKYMYVIDPCLLILPLRIGF